MFGHRYKSESGIIVVNGSVVASTQQCVHCGNHEMIIPGSGKKRGWCGMCAGFVCGKKFCMMNCIPFEAKIEYQEAQSSGNMGQLNKLASRYPELKQLHF